MAEEPTGVQAGFDGFHGFPIGGGEEEMEQVAFAFAEAVFGTDGATAEDGFVANSWRRCWDFSAWAGVRGAC